MCMFVLSSKLLNPDSVRLIHQNDEPPPTKTVKLLQKLSIDTSEDIIVMWVAVRRCRSKMLACRSIGLKMTMIPGLLATAHCSARWASFIVNLINTAYDWRYCINVFIFILHKIWNAFLLSFYCGGLFQKQFCHTCSVKTYTAVFLNENPHTLNMMKTLFRTSTCKTESSLYWPVAL